MQRWVVSFMLQLIYPWGKTCWYSSDRRLGQPQSQPVHYSKEKKTLPLPGTDPINNKIHILHTPLTSNFGSPVQRLRSRNSSWIVVTSEVLLSGLHLGEWALRVARFTSEYGTPESELKHGSNRVPRSICKTIFQMINYINSPSYKTSIICIYTTMVWQNMKCNNTCLGDLMSITESQGPTDW